MEANKEKPQSKFEPIKLDFSYDLKTANFEVDRMQNELIQDYIRIDMRFRRAFFMDKTQVFIEFLKDKARLREPTSLSFMGNVRTFTDNNFIFTKNGWKKPSEMIVGEKVLSYNFDSEKYEWQKSAIVRRERNKKEKFYKIIFSDKREIELGENHPIFTKLKGWKKARSLYPDIEVPIFDRYPSTIDNLKISKELTRIIAFLLSCGHLNNSEYIFLDKRDGKHYRKKAYAIGYANSQIELVRQFRRDFKKLFKKEIKYKNDKKNRNCYYLEKSSKPIFQILNKFVPSGKKSHILRVPNEILRANYTIHREFISALFSGDGYVPKQKSKESCKGLIEYYSCSKEFLKDIQLIFIRYGIKSYIIKKKTKTRYIFRLTITNKQNIQNFCKFIKSFYSHKKDLRMKQIIKKYNKDIASQRPNKLSIKEIVKLEIKDEYIYDIFVEKNNNFMLNGILTHNSGKSYSAISLAMLINYFHGRIMDSRYICGNDMEYLERLEEMEEADLNNSSFIIDEAKGKFGQGAFTKKSRLQDVANIIAKFNISLITLCPTKFMNQNSSLYGLRAFGRDFKQKVNRFMIYNLQEGEHGGIKPFGMAYIPIFTKLFPKEISEPFEKEYTKRKDNWIMDEVRGKQDIMYYFKERHGKNFINDKKYMELSKKDEKLTYIRMKIGSDWSIGEIKEIYNITKLMEKGMMPEKS